MSQSKGHTRQLGSVRHFQNLGRNNSQAALSCKLDKTYEGISGSALSVPLKLSAKGLREPHIIVNNEQSWTSTILTKQAYTASNQELTESEELNEPISSNKKLDDEVTKNLIKEVQDFKETSELFENEKVEHARCRHELEQTKVSLVKEIQRSKSMKSQLDMQILDISNMLKIQDLEYTKNHMLQDAEILFRDNKLERLKKQVADALKVNSKERQQQLQELSIELEKVQEEADILRKSLKSLQNSSKENCNNCERLNVKVNQLASDVQEKDQLISALNCRLST